jgi:hypothetical protein
MAWRIACDAFITLYVEVARCVFRIRLVAPIRHDSKTLTFCRVVSDSLLKHSDLPNRGGYLIDLRARWVKGSPE